MNHQGKQDQRPEGGHHPTQKSEDIPSKLAGDFEHARRPEEEPHRAGADLGSGAVNTPRGSAKDERRASANADEIPAAMPAALGDRDKREAQYSEPGAGFGDSERTPRAALQDTEGSSDTSDLDTRGEDDSRRDHDVARGAVAEQKRRLGLGDRDSKLPDEQPRR